MGATDIICLSPRPNSAHKALEPSKLIRALEATKGEKGRGGRNLSHLECSGWLFAGAGFSRSLRDGQAGPQQQVARTLGAAGRGTRDAQEGVENCVCGDSRHFVTESERGQVE